MALKKPAFEQEPTTAAATAEHAVPETAYSEAATAVVDEPIQHQGVAAVTTAVTVAKASALGKSAVADAAATAKEFQKEFNSMKGASDFSYGTYRVFKGSNGALTESGGEQADLGRWAKVRLLSWDRHFEVSPGESGASTKGFVAYSKDGVTIDSVIGEDVKAWEGRTVADYVHYLRTEEEFANTKTREFIDMACALIATDSGDGPVGRVIQITLSETSIPSFKAYQQELNDTARCQAMGLPGFVLPEDPFQLFVIREVAKRGSNTWTKLRLSANLPSKL